jgi:hypothetical protein
VERNLSRTSLALFFFSLILILSVVGMFLMVSIYHPSYAVVATSKTNIEPERYVVLENPDKYTLEAINSPSGDSSIFTSYDDTNIDDLNQANAQQFDYKDFYYKYDNTYYKFALLIGDKFPPFMLPQILLAGIVVSAAAITVIGLSKAAKYIIKTRKQKSD